MLVDKQKLTGLFLKKVIMMCGIEIFLKVYIICLKKIDNSIVKLEVERDDTG